MDGILITEEPLNPEDFTRQVRQDYNGAVVTFLGTTRDSFEGKRVVRLEYEGYTDMAYKKLEEIRQQLREEFGLRDVAIGHRLGPVDIGEISLVVAVASPHRKEAFLACHEAVNRLKETVPIWKKEFYEGGSHWVACEDHEFAAGSAAEAAEPEAEPANVLADDN